VSIHINLLLRILPLRRGSPKSPEGNAEDTKNWATLRRFGGLADLPSHATLQHVSEDERTPLQDLKIEFTAPTQEVKQWLEASVSKTALELAERLVKAGAQTWRYLARNHCWIEVTYSDEGPARASVWRRSRILIAE
jgi:hypothetical protein